MRGLATSCCGRRSRRRFAAHDGEPLQVRVGLNAGEPIEEDDTVRGLSSGKGFMFSDRGEFVPKGFDEGVRLWDVRWTQ